MKRTKFLIIFLSENSLPSDVVDVYAFSKEEAKILAQADRIRAGKSYKIFKIIKTEKTSQ